MARKTSEESIFGTPSEPLFNLRPDSFSSDILEEWLSILIKENEERIKTASLKQGFFKTGQVTEFVFNTCEKLKVAHEARYLAVELFDKFMIQHTYDLYSHVQKNGADHKRKDWTAIVERVNNLLMLRVVTCCQLASKLTSHYKIVTPQRALRALNEFGHMYSTESILQSEIRVAKTLGFRVMLTTPVTYVETVLVCLGRMNEKFPVKMYHGTSVRVLDVVYMKRSELYDCLFLSVHGHSRKSPEDIAKFSGVEHDLLLLTVAVVAASVYITDQPMTDKVIEKLTLIAHIDSNDIIDFASVIIKLLVQDKEQ